MSLFDRMNVAYYPLWFQVYFVDMTLVELGSELPKYIGHKDIALKDISKELNEIEKH